MTSTGPAAPDPDPIPDPVPDQTSDDLPTGWGEDLREESEDDRDAWYLRERPPHHGD